MATQQISFDVSEYDETLISDIADRAFDLIRKHGGQVSKLDTIMDLTAVHANGNPLRLEDLLAADDFNLLHDVCGIERHLNRKTGQLENHFSPRFSKRETASA